MPAVTWFERQMEKALTDNIHAMFAVPLGDSHRHAYVKGERSGLDKAMGFFKKEHDIDDEKDDV